MRRIVGFGGSTMRDVRMPFQCLIIVKFNLFVAAVYLLVTSHDQIVSRTSEVCLNWIKENRYTLSPMPKKFFFVLLDSQ